MRALTLWQPYASGVAVYFKRVENRTWTPPASLLGERIAIHAGARRYDAWRLPEGVAIPEPLPRSAVLCTAIVVGALDLRDGVRKVVSRESGGGALDFFGVQAPGVEKLEDLDRDPWWLGPVGWLLDDVRTLREPVSCKGAMGLWTLSAEVESAVRAAGG